MSKDQNLIATGSYGGTVALFDVRTGLWEKFEKPTASGISCLTQAANGNGFLASAYDGRIYPITARAGRPLLS